SYTMYFTALLLMLIAGVYFFAWESKSRNKPAVVTAIVAGALAGYAGVRRDSHSSSSEWVERFRGNSNFGLMQVVDNPGGTRRTYLNDFLSQNVYDPGAKKSTTLFTYMLHDLARAYTRRIDRALCIGLGMGIVPTRLAREGIRVDVVEINPAVAPVAKEYFGCEPERFRLETADGRDWVNRTTNRYDAILLDAILGDSSPSHLLTREAFDAMRRVLQPGGTLVINSFADFR